MLAENGIDEEKLLDEEINEDYNLRRFQIINSTVNSQLFQINSEKKSS